MKYIAFINGRILEGVVLDNIISAAKRGKMTPAGEKLLLVPDTRYGRKDESGLRLMSRVRKKDCRTLKQLYGRRKSKTLRKVA